MATGLKSRVIWKMHTEENLWTGTWKMLMRPKSIPSPIGERSMVDCSTLEDLQEVQEAGRRASASVSIQGAMEKEYIDAINEIGENTKIDIMHLYGSEGEGSIMKLAYVGTIGLTPDEATEDHLTMTANISVSTVPKIVTDQFTVTASGEGANMTFTVAAKSNG